MAYRHKLFRKSSNPLIESIIRELILEERQSGNRLLVDRYERALKSLSRHPLHLKTGRECIILEHFNRTLCTRIDSKLRKIHRSRKMNLANKSSSSSSSDAIYSDSEPDGPSQASQDQDKRPSLTDNQREIIVLSSDDEQERKSDESEVKEVVRQLEEETRFSETKMNIHPIDFEALQNDDSSFEIPIAAPLPSCSTNKKLDRPFDETTVSSLDLMEKKILYDISCYEKATGLGASKRYEDILVVSHLAASTDADKSDTAVVDSIRYLLKNNLISVQLRDPPQNSYMNPVDSSSDTDRDVEIDASSRSYANGCRYSMTDRGRMFAKLMEKSDWAEVPKEIYNDFPDEPEPDPDENIFCSVKPLDLDEDSSDDSSSMDSNNLASFEPCPSPLGSNEDEDEVLIVEDDDDDDDLDTIITLFPGTFQIVLLVDTAECVAYTKKNTGKSLVTVLKGFGINVEARKLNVGDFLWIAKHPEGTELVLPHIVERKTIEDLRQSIKDGRYRDQKFRLKRCNLQVVFLIEGPLREITYGHSSIAKAVFGSMVPPRFSVRLTASLSHSIHFLVSMTKELEKLYLTRKINSFPEVDLIPCGYDPNAACVFAPRLADFMRGLIKSRIVNVRDLFMKQLVQMHGISAEKAKAISDKFETPMVLISAFMEAGPVAGPKLLADVEFGITRRRIGPAIAATLYHFYTSIDFE